MYIDENGKAHIIVCPNCRKQCNPKDIRLVDMECTHSGATFNEATGNMDFKVTFKTKMRCTRCINQ